ncbi:MAG: hypothetical protein HW382_1242 [Deltaproteobacteria bacterium]|nr:hypothetical protein [Deltaproteobacteria bacterium]
MNNLRDLLATSHFIKAAFETSNDLRYKVFLVGGTVRDLLLKEALGTDFDFAVEGNASSFARAFAKIIKGSFFVIDKKRDTSRVISNRGLQADFSVIRGKIEEDLMLRDFTVNSMAISLDSIFETGASTILDPLDGKTDIKNRLLRTSSQNSIHEDPLRVMRAFRFSSSLDFAMDEELSSQIKKHCEELNSVSEERVRAELFMILEMPAAYKTLKDMDDAGVLRTLFPETEKWKRFYQGGWHIHDLFDHSMNAVCKAEEILNHLNGYFPGYAKKIEDYMAEEVEDYVTRRGLVKIAALLHDSGKLYTRTMQDGRGRFLGHEEKGEAISSDIARRLKLSRQTEKILRGLTANHMRILGLSKLQRVTPRAKYRFFRDVDGYGLELLILSLADAMATPIEGKRLEDLKGLIGNLAGYYFEEFIAAPPMPLVTGEDIMKLLGIPQGKEIGRMVEALREAEALGKVSSREEALGAGG